jgi:hypothetical protein
VIPELITGVTREIDAAGVALTDAVGNGQRGDAQKQRRILVQLRAAQRHLEYATEIVDDLDENTLDPFTDDYAAPSVHDEVSP